MFPPHVIKQVLFKVGKKCNFCGFIFYVICKYEECTIFDTSVEMYCMGCKKMLWGFQAIEQKCNCPRNYEMVICRKVYISPEVIKQDV